MTKAWEDEETWDEEPYRRPSKPLTLQLVVRPAGSRPRAREEARHLLEELLGLTPEKRLVELLGERFRRPELLELLLELSHAALPFDVSRAVELASLATEIGPRLPRTGGPEDTAGACRALCLAATARRMMGDYAIADAAFQQAGPLAGSVPERGWFCRALALLRWDQGRMEEALALLQQAEQRFAEMQDFPEVAVCRALLGLLHLDEERIARAASCLAQASQDLPEGPRPWLAAQTWLGLSICWAAGGRLGKARAARQRAWSYYAEVKDERALSWIQWMEGRGAHLLGESQEAEALLGEVRRTMLGRRHLPEATLATLDLALVWLDLGRGSEVGGLVEEIAATFAGSPGLDLALSGLEQPGAHAVDGRLSPSAWRALGPVLRLAFRLQGPPLQPVPFA
ncbi:MAG TPA: hypothetical protein VGP73_20340 [Thermoanaerobaculia bacterium]